MFKVPRIPTHAETLPISTLATTEKRQVQPVIKCTNLSSVGSVTHTTSPFAATFYTPPSGAPGFKGDRYDWDKGFSDELEKVSSSVKDGYGRPDGDGIGVSASLSSSRSSGRVSASQGWGTGFGFGFGSMRGQSLGSSNSFLDLERELTVEMDMKVEDQDRLHLIHGKLTRILPISKIIIVDLHRSHPSSLEALAG